MEPRTTREYVYRIAAVEKVTDGDTYWLHLDVGFRQMQLTHLRLLNYDTPEVNRGSDFEKSEAQRATAVVHEFFAQPGVHWCCTAKDPDNFGRWLAEIWSETLVQTESGLHVQRMWLHDVLMKQELATAWPTRWREVYDQ